MADAGMACVWELEIIDFERRACLEDVLTATTSTATSSGL